MIDWVKQGLLTSENDEAFAYFYCNKQDPARSEPKEILRNLVRQLAIGPWNESANNTIVHKTVHELWLKAQGKGISSIFSEWEECLRALIDTYPRTTIVLDALDECKIQQRQDLIKLVVKLATRGSEAKPVKIFVAARPEDDVRQHLDKYHVIRMQEKQNAKDIAVFIRKKISQHSEWPSMSKEFRRYLVDRLLQKSQNMFLFASLQIDSLKYCWFEEDIRDGLEKLPATLTAAYEDIYQKATEKPTAKVFTDRALRWVMCSARPLTTEELLFAICQDPKAGAIAAIRGDVSEKWMSKLCHNLLVQENSHGETRRVWRLAHQGVADFLEERTCCNSSLAHCESAKVCLMILLDTFGGDASETWSRTERDSEYDTEVVLCPYGNLIGPYEGRHPYLPGLLAEYAVYGWLTHVRAQEHDTKRSNDGMSQTLQKFLGQPQRGSAAYTRWFRHALHDKSEYEFTEWCIFKSRWTQRVAITEDTMMAPLTLACYLGIYNCLLDWWDSSNVDYDRVYQSPYSWEPNPEWPPWNYNPRGWSLLALACVHNETIIIKHLLGKKVRVNTTGEDDVPPIVAAAVADSVETVEDLIKSGADICSPFTTRHGHLLRFAIRSNSLGVMKLLLQQPGLSQVSEVGEVLRSTGWQDFRSADAMEMVIGTGVNVNTPLSDRSLLFAAADNGWENIVCILLGKGADVNLHNPPGHWSVILAYIRHGSPSPSMVTQLIKHGAHVTSQDVAGAEALARREGVRRPFSHEVETRREILQLILGCKPDMNEPWTRSDRNNTSVLIEAVLDRDMDQVRFLVRHGANVNLRVGGSYDYALNCAFDGTMDRSRWHDPDSDREMIDALVEEGASLDSLEGDHLHRALAAAASAGWEDLVQDLLNSGASPYGFCGRTYQTALGAAAASDHPRAPAIVHMLLNNGPGTSKDNGFFEAARMALHEPLYNLLTHEYPTYMLCMDPWLGSASVLAQHHAFWDIDFEQWDKCLKKRNPEFRKQYAESLAKLQKMLEGNRTEFFLKFPEAASYEEWRIKDAEDAGSDDTLPPAQKSILDEFSSYLRLID